MGRKDLDAIGRRRRNLVRGLAAGAGALMVMTALAVAAQVGVGLARPSSERITLDAPITPAVRGLRLPATRHTPLSLQRYRGKAIVLFFYEAST